MSATITTLTAVAAGSLTITGKSGAAVDIGAIAASGSVSNRIDQVVAAINKVSGDTGVNATYNTTTDEIELSATEQGAWDGSFTIGGTDDGTLTGFDGATGVTSTAGATGALNAPGHLLGRRRHRRTHPDRQRPGHHQRLPRHPGCGSEPF